jgi:hypothetical protein
MSSSNRVASIVVGRNCLRRAKDSSLSVSSVPRRTARNALSISVVEAGGMPGSAASNCRQPTAPSSDC